MNFQYPPKPQENDGKLNEQKMAYICDELIDILKFMRQNKEIYKNNRDEMARMIKLEKPNFYQLYPRVCRSIIYEDDIQELIKMIHMFGNVQEKNMDWEKANKIICEDLNDKYVNPILNSEKLTNERKNMIDITDKCEI